MYNEEWRELEEFPDYVMNEFCVIRNVVTKKTVVVRDDGKGFQLVWLRDRRGRFVGRGVEKLFRRTFPDVAI